MSEISYAGLHILVVDDELFMRKLVERILTELGVGHVSGAENGLAGLNILKSISGTIDVIICDLEMPEMNGFEFVKQVRSSPDVPDQNVPIVILTGHADEETVRNAANLGINGYLIKPVSKTSLESRISKALNSRT